MRFFYLSYKLKRQLVMMPDNILNRSLIMEHIFQFKCVYQVTKGRMKQMTNCKIFSTLKQTKIKQYLILENYKSVITMIYIYEKSKEKK